MIQGFGGSDCRRAAAAPDPVGPCCQPGVASLGWLMRAPPRERADHQRCYQSDTRLLPPHGRLAALCGGRGSTPRLVAGASRLDLMKDPMSAQPGNAEPGILAVAADSRPGRRTVLKVFGSSVSAVLVGATLAALVSGLTACGQSLPCEGQCGPPFQLQVSFRTGTSAQAAAAAMSNCAAKPFVVRIGSVGRRQGSPIATVYTEAARGHQSDRLLACLHRSPLVYSAGYPD